MHWFRPELIQEIPHELWADGKFSNQDNIIKVSNPVVRVNEAKLCAMYALLFYIVEVMGRLLLFYIVGVMGRLLLFYIVGVMGRLLLFYVVGVMGRLLLFYVVGVMGRFP